jgi:hypothetical protein
LLRELGGLVEMVEKLSKRILERGEVVVGRCISYAIESQVQDTLEEKSSRNSAVTIIRILSCKE